MQLRSALACVLAASAILGLVLAPIARPVVAMPMDMHAVMGEPTAPDAVATTMPDDMPCCPDKATVPDCSKDCPLMALCGATLVQFVPQMALIVPLPYEHRFPGRLFRSCERRPRSPSKTSQNLGSEPSVKADGRSA